MNVLSIKSVVFVIYLISTYDSSCIYLLLMRRKFIMMLIHINDIFGYFRQVLSRVLMFTLDSVVG